MAIALRPSIDDDSDWVQGHDGMSGVSDCSDAVLAEACGERALRAGIAYQREGRVAELAVSQDGRRITARVRGNEKKPYRQTIDLGTTKAGAVVVTGACSCPVGFNCKHVAAVLVAARSLSPGPRLAAATSGQASAPPPARPAWPAMSALAR